MNSDPSKEKVDEKENTVIKYIEFPDPVISNKFP